MYAVSNVVFLLLLAKPIGKMLERIQTKYGL
jgi:energy-coupling factor transport system substrate-specific component